MQPATPSRTAYRVALRRAAHQVFDEPVVFRDPYALPILGLTPGKLDGTDLRAPRRPSSSSLRAFLVARSLFAEEALAKFVRTQSGSQYVLLGAGLDTFALRNPYPGLRVFEVDHPSTQQWKRDLLRSGGLHLPPTATLVGSDFEADDLCGSLLANGFDPSLPTLFAMLGVVPYLSLAAFQQTLAVIGSFSGPRALVMDYGLPREALPPDEQLAFKSLADRVAQAGEPFRLFFTGTEAAEHLRAAGLHVGEELLPAQMNARFFAGRGSALRVLGSGARLLLAQAGSP